MKKPLVSVIMPIKGRLKLVQEALESIQNQKNFSPDKIEVFLIEEKSEPYPIFAQIKKMFPAVKTLKNSDKEGPGGARNTGLKHARGKYVHFLDSDDRPQTEFLIEMIKALESDRKASAVFCLSKSYFDPAFSILERIKLYPLMFIRDISLMLGYFFNRGYLYPSSFYLCQLSHMMFKAEKIKKLHFNYDYRRGGEDWDFFVNSQKCGPVKILPGRLMNFRFFAGSSTDTPINRQLKWRSYSLLVQRLPKEFRRGIFYKLFLAYIKLFGGKDVK